MVAIAPHPREHQLTRNGHRTLLAAIADPFAIRGASLGPAKWDRKNPVGRSEEDPGDTA